MSVRPRPTAFYEARITLLCAKQMRASSPPSLASLRCRLRRTSRKWFLNARQIRINDRSRLRTVRARYIVARSLYNNLRREYSQREQSSRARAGLKRAPTKRTRNALESIVIVRVQCSTRRDTGGGGLYRVPLVFISLRRAHFVARQDRFAFASPQLIA